MVQRVGVLHPIEQTVDRPDRVMDLDTAVVAAVAVAVVVDNRWQGPTSRALRMVVEAAGWAARKVGLAEEAGKDLVAPGCSLAPGIAGRAPAAVDTGLVERSVEGRAPAGMEKPVVRSAARDKFAAG